MADKKVMSVFTLRLPDEVVAYLKTRAAEETLKRDDGEVVLWTHLARQQLEKAVGDMKNETEAVAA